MIRFSLAFSLLLFSIQILAKDIKSLSFGTDSTLEIMTWNLEHFPKNGQTTIDSVRKIIEVLDIDIIAFQEINDKTTFMELADSLPNYTGFTPENKYNSLAYLFKTELINRIDIFEIYTDTWHELPRAPLILEFTFRDEKLFVINNHFKCCGDGVLKVNDRYDEENRRWKASQLLDEYIQTHLPNEKIFVVGDLNDNITDQAPNNVFRNFLDKPDEYLFADMDIAEGNETRWSYPWYPSHIDHILITNELFEVFKDSLSDIQTLRIDKEMKDGMYEYDEKISDHRPVAIKLNAKKLPASTINFTNKSSFGVYPNPTKGTISISGNNKKIRSIFLYNSDGKRIFQLKDLNYKGTFSFHPKLKPGLYFIQISGENNFHRQKLIVL